MVAFVSKKTVQCCVALMFMAEMIQGKLFLGEVSDKDYASHVCISDTPTGTFKKAFNGKGYDCGACDNIKSSKKCIPNDGELPAYYPVTSPKDGPSKDVKFVALVTVDKNGQTICQSGKDRGQPGTDPTFRQCT